MQHNYMALRIAIVGPGRVGTAFASRFVRAGASFRGFVGRDPEQVAQRVAAAGAGAAVRRRLVGRIRALAIAARRAGAVHRLSRRQPRAVPERDPDSDRSH